MINGKLIKFRLPKFKKVPETSLDERLKILEHNGKIFQWWKYLQVLRTDRVYERNKYPIDVTAFHANSVDIDKMKTYLHPSDVGINFITEDNDVPVGMLWIDMDRVFYDFSLTDIDYDAFMNEEERWRLEF